MIGLATILISLFILFLLVILIMIAFWIWMIVDAAKRDYPKSDEKVLWILVIVLGGFIGAIVYYFVVKYNS